MVTQLIDDGDDIDLCFFDFSKAVDIANHRIICAMLDAIGVSSQVVRLIQSFLENGSFQVSINDLFSEEPAVLKTLSLGHYYS